MCHNSQTPSHILGSSGNSIKLLSSFLTYFSPAPHVHGPGQAWLGRSTRRRGTEKTLGHPRLPLVSYCVCKAHPYPVAMFSEPKELRAGPWVVLTPPQCHCPGCLIFHLTAIFWDGLYLFIVPSILLIQVCFLMALWITTGTPFWLFNRIRTEDTISSNGPWVPPRLLLTRILWHQLSPDRTQQLTAGFWGTSSSLAPWQWSPCN
jgi:hypothetical protein